jgi:general secretion pathway protein M
MPALSAKDRRALIIGITALVVFVLVQFVLFPLLDGRKRLERGIRVKEKGLVEMRAMQKSYGQRSKQNNSLAEQVDRRSTNFGLFAFIEKKAAEAKVKENIAYMKPSDPSGEGELQQVMVELKLKAVNLKQLVAFLERIESPQNVVAVKRISIQENKKEKGSLDVIMQVISLVQAGKDAG